MPPAKETAPGGARDLLDARAALERESQARHRAEWERDHEHQQVLAARAEAKAARLDEDDARRDLENLRRDAGERIAVNQQARVRADLDAEDLRAKVRELTAVGAARESVEAQLEDLSRKLARSEQARQAAESKAGAANAELLALRRSLEERSGREQELQREVEQARRRQAQSDEQASRKLAEDESARKKVEADAIRARDDARAAAEASSRAARLAEDERRAAQARVDEITRKLEASERARTALETESVATKKLADDRVASEMARRRAEEEAFKARDGARTATRSPQEKNAAEPARSVGSESRERSSDARLEEELREIAKGGGSSATAPPQVAQPTEIVPAARPERRPTPSVREPDLALAGPRTQPSSVIPPGLFADDARRPDSAHGVKPGVIQRADVLSIDAGDAIEISGEHAVGDDGKVDLPLVGPLKVAGSSGPEVAALIEKKLVGFILKPHVTVQVRQKVKELAVVSGAVERPGPYPIEANGSSVAQLILDAGGVEPGLLHVRVEHGPAQGSGDEAAETTRLDVAAEGLLSSELAAMKVAPGDTVTVRPIWIVTVEGAVKNPGSFTLLRTPTIADVIEAAGGTTTFGKADRARIERADGTSAESGDETIHDGDVIHVPGLLGG